MFQSLTFFPTLLAVSDIGIVNEKQSTPYATNREKFHFQFVDLVKLDLFENDACHKKEKEITIFD